MYVVLVAGGHASGKRTATNDLEQLLVEQAAAKGVRLATRVVDLREYSPTSFRTPADVDFGKLVADLKSSQNSENLVTFVYGNYALCEAGVRELAAMRIFLDTDADERLSRWIMRDVVQSKRSTLEKVVETYLGQSRIEFRDFIEASKSYADVLLPLGSDHLSSKVIVSGILSDLTTGNTARDSKRPQINLRDEEQVSFYSTD